MDTVVLDTIPYIPDLPDLMMKLRIRQEQPQRGRTAIYGQGSADGGSP